MTFGGMQGANQEDYIGRMPTEIDEDLEERDEEAIQDGDIDESEARAIENIREEELNKIIGAREEDNLQAYLK
jgi:hypothetical protein